MYIIKVCKWYGYSKDQLHRLFESLIMSLFMCGAAGYKGKTFIRRAARFGYVSDATPMSFILDKREIKLFRKITSDGNHIHEILPDKRNRALREREHEHILPRVKTERFKRAFINRCLFKP